MFGLLKIYYCNMANFEHCYEDALFFLTEKRRKKAEKIINKNEALLSTVSGLMLRKVLGVTDDENFEFNEHGKPFLKNGPFFNISHSHRYAVLAVCENEVGIDIEMRETPNERAMERCFTVEEKNYAAVSTENFLKVWTAKEAVLKLLGTGFSHSPKNFSVIPFEEKCIANGKEINILYGKIEEIPFSTALYTEEKDYKIKEFLPEDLLY